MEIPKITGPDMLRAIKARTKDMPDGDTFTISLFDSYDLFKLNAKQLVDEFGFDEAVADRVDRDLLAGSLVELSRHIGINLAVDKTNAGSLIPNAGILRSAGAFQDDPASLEDTWRFFDSLRQS